MTKHLRTFAPLFTTLLASTIFALAPVVPSFGENTNSTAMLAGIPAANAATFVPLADFNASPKLRDAYTNSSDLGTFMNKVFVGAISLGAILAVLRLAWAGFVYMGTDLWGKKEHAKEVITDTLLGLFLLIAVYLILNQINPQILSLKITAPAPQSINNSAGPGSGNAPTPSDTGASLFQVPVNTYTGTDNGIPTTP